VTPFAVTEGEEREDMAGKSVKERLMRGGAMLREDLRARERKEGRKEVRGGRQKEVVVLVGGCGRRKKRRKSQ
jgi:hypothetical protein